MDFAKIRKKLKGSGTDIQQQKTNDQGQQAEEPVTVSGQAIPEPARNPDSFPESEQQPEKEQSVEIEGFPEKPPPEAREPGKKYDGIPKDTAMEKPSAVDKSDETIEILTFHLSKEDFAFRISQLHEIIRFQRITKVPKTSDFVLGITSLRGKTIPVIDLKQKLFLTDKVSFKNRDSKILIIKGSKGPIGVAVDKVVGVVNIPKSELLPPPSHLSETELRFIDGIAIVDKRFVSIINMEEATALI
jgi:purine-binding chemotaxis protein CheW